MDTSILRQQLNSVVPFNRTVGVEVIEIEAGRAVARLQQTAAVANHVGTLHAGALFTLADAASGAAVVGLYADEIGRATLVVASSEVTFSRPARGTITAVAAADEERPAVEERLSRDGRAELLVKVGLTDVEGREVARASVHWHIRR